jgi:hypothetical protein
VLNASGEIVDVEGPPWRLGGKRRRSTLLVPQRRTTTDGASSGFLWGRSAHALGVAKGVQGGGPRVNMQAFNHFRSVHRSMLEGATNPSLQAFVAFLQRWNPQNTADLDNVAGVGGAALAFRFRYDDCFLHETHAARIIWERSLNPALGQASAGSAAAMGAKPSA